MKGESWGIQAVKLAAAYVVDIEVIEICLENVLNGFEDPQVVTTVCAQQAMLREVSMTLIL
jgi:hypothetical protein